MSFLDRIDFELRLNLITVDDDSDGLLRKKMPRVASSGYAQYVAQELFSLLFPNLEWITGLAANQVGFEDAICIVVKEDSSFLVMVNPELVSTASFRTAAWEGCASIPDTIVYVSRPDFAVFNFTDLSGNLREEVLYEHDARVALHEVDHLNGVLITDYGTPHPIESTRDPLLTE